jgi:predicted Zn-dependent peptidase
VEIPRLTPGEPKVAELPTREETTLSNGIRLVHYRMAGAPMVYLSTAVTGGGNNDPRGKEGLYGIAVDMGWRGAGDKDLQALGRALKDIGGTVGTWGGAIMSGATLQVPPKHLAAGVELLADVVQKPQFAQSEWDIVKAGMLNYVVQRDNDVTGMAQRAMNRVIFFPGENEPEMNMSVQSVQAITLDDAKAVYDELFVPKTMVIYSVGDVSLDEVKAALETRFGHWSKAGDGVASKATPTAVFPNEQQVYLVPMPGTSQATIHIARAAPGYLEPTFASASAVSSLLAGDFGSRLNSVIREQKGYSYGVSGLVWNWYLKDSGMSVTIPVQIDATGAALEEAFKGFDSLTSVPVTADEVNRTVTANFTALATLPETAAGFFNAFVGWEKEGIDFNRTIASLREMTRLQVTDVQAEALRLGLLDHAVVIIAGDPALILPQLEALGITDVRPVPPLRNAG